MKPCTIRTAIGLRSRNWGGPYARFGVVQLASGSARAEAWLKPKKGGEKFLAVKEMQAGG